jgi:hypothetical protein
MFEKSFDSVVIAMLEQLSRSHEHKLNLFALLSYLFSGRFVIPLLAKLDEVQCLEPQSECMLEV